jgi:hypothetical protein
MGKQDELALHELHGSFHQLCPQAVLNWCKYLENERVLPCTDASASAETEGGINWKGFLSSGSAFGHTNSHGFDVDACHNITFPCPSNPGTTLKTARNSEQRNNHRHCVSTFTRHDVNVAVRDWKCPCSPPK